VRDLSAAADADDGRDAAGCARWVASQHWGYFYGANTVGGVIGCFAAGFYLLRVFDMAVASYIAAGLNFIVGLLALVLARKLRWEAAVESVRGWKVANSGFCWQSGFPDLRRWERRWCGHASCR